MVMSAAQVLIARVVENFRSRWFEPSARREVFARRLEKIVE